MTLDDFLKALAIDLNDNEPGYEFTHWSRQQLINYLNEGLEIVRYFKPEMFSKVAVMPLEIGDVQTADGFIYISDILGECDQYGRMLSSGLPRRSRAAMRRWTKPPIRQMDGYRVQGYWDDSMKGEKSSEIYVFPPVPADNAYYLKIKGVGSVKPYKLKDTRRKMPENGTLPALTQWVLFRAFNAEIESQATRLAAQQALTLFFQMLRIQFTRETVNRIGTEASVQGTSAINILRGAGVLNTPQ